MLEREVKGWAVLRGDEPVGFLFVQPMPWEYVATHFRIVPARIILEVEDGI